MTILKQKFEKLVNADTALSFEEFNADPDLVLMDAIVSSLKLHHKFHLKGKKEEDEIKLRSALEYIEEQYPGIVKSLSNATDQIKLDTMARASNYFESLKQRGNQDKTEVLVDIACAAYEHYNK